MQAMAVFLLEMSYGGVHMTKRDNEDIPKCIKRLVRWLRSMRRVDGVASRAYKVVIGILKNGELREQDDIVGILAEDDADTDRGHMLRTYQETTQAPTSENTFARDEWQAQSDYYPPPNDNFAQMPDPFFLPDQFQVPQGYGNPFLTNFDQSNPFSLNMDDLMMVDGDASLQYPQLQEQYNHMRLG